MHFIYARTQIKTKVPILKMLEDGCSQCTVFSLKTLYKLVAQVDENKTEMLFICSHEIRQ